MDYQHFMRLALNEAEKALENNEFPVGCVIVYKNEVIVTGSRQGTSGTQHNELDHAEIVALRRLFDFKQKISIDPAELTVFCTMEPCLMCFGALLINNIRHIVYAYEDAMGGATNCDLKSMSPLYNQNVKIIKGVLRSQSLNLFKQFFSSEKNTYLKNTFLAKYTLSQD